MTNEQSPTDDKNKLNTNTPPYPQSLKWPRYPWMSTLLAVSLLGLVACDGGEDEPGPGGSEDEVPSDTHPLPTPKGAAIDVHTHLASQTLTDLLTGGGVPAADATDLVARLDEAKIKRGIVLSAGFFDLPDNSNMALENDWVASQIAKYPDRLIGFCGIHPLYENAVEEVDRCLALPGMVGVKLHMDGSRVDLSNMDHALALWDVFDRIEANDAPVLMHVSDAFGGTLRGEGFANLSFLISEHPTLRITHAHCAGNVEDDAIEYWLRMGDSGYRENAFVDVSACLAFYSDAPLAMREQLVWRLRTWGIDRVLFGSDYFQYGEDETPKETLATLASYPFTQEELDTIVGNDASAWLESPE